jgi:predicted nucleic acid-binding Zn ribbon protein
VREIEIDKEKKREKKHFILIVLVVKALEFVVIATIVIPVADTIVLLVAQRKFDSD